MNLTRKQFLKLTGLTTVAGAGGMAAVSILAKPHGAEKADKTKKRWGLVIDMSKCEEGCNKCTLACHDTHNVPDFKNPKDEIKWIWKEKFHHLFPDQSSQFENAEIQEKPFLTLCNHCENPPCTRVCPTQATFKRKSDGIVMMDFHRCIGCRFCMAGCPYGSRSFNYREPRTHIAKINPGFPTRTKGVVEKCNLCEERIVKGKIPVCSEVCESGAIVFGDLNDPQSPARQAMIGKRTLRRKAELGTSPSVFYII